MESTKGADIVIVADTGSNDDTIEILRKHGAIVSQININPWRFDKARNASLNLIPTDIDVCICLDLDEILCPNWREGIEKYWKDNTTRLRYEYTWSWLSDGKPDVVYYADKIHARHGYEWRHPVHECLYYIGTGKENIEFGGLKVEHHPDNSKSRGSYLQLLELSVKEDPDNDRNSYYLGREYYFYKQYDKAINELERHLKLPSARWLPERSASMKFIASSYSKKNNQDQSIIWLMRACAEASKERESWVELAQAYLNQKNYLGGYYAAIQALNIKERPRSYITKGVAWGAWPHDVAGTCAFYIGLQQKSLEHYEDALKLDSNNQRIVANLELVRERLNGKLPSK